MHSLHHRNDDPEPFSGITMHPVEHLYYFANAFTPSLYISGLSPLIFLWNFMCVRACVRTVVLLLLVAHTHKAYMLLVPLRTDGRTDATACLLAAHARHQHATDHHNQLTEHSTDQPTDQPTN